MGSVECKNVAGAIDKGIVQDKRDFKFDMTERGGWVEGVSISLILAMSRGARTTPAMHAAETATDKEAMGVGELRISRPPVRP